MSLTESELAEAVAKVGRPRSHSSTFIPVDVDKAKALLEAGFSWNQVGEFFGCSGMTIRRRLRGHLIRARPDPWASVEKRPELPWPPWLNPYK